MSDYLGNFGPEANLGDVFKDLNSRAGQIIGEESSLLSEDRPVVDPPGVDLKYKFVSQEASVASRRPATASVIVLATEAKGNAPMVLLAMQARAKSLERGSGYEAASLAAAGQKGWIPTYSIERNSVGSIVSRQILVPSGLDLRFDMSPPGTSKAHHEQPLGSIDENHKARLSLVSSVIVRNLEIIELIKEGRTLKQAFRAIADRPGSKH